MSKIGKKPVEIPEKVSAAIEKEEISVKGPLGEIRIPRLRGINVLKDGNMIRCEAVNQKKETRSAWGTMRSLLANAMQGVTQGFEKTLILEGIGYRIKKEGEGLVCALGFSHPVRVVPEEGIRFEVEKNTIVKISGIDKAKVGQAAAKIRALKKPEPYKGKGFRYSSEVIRRKAGKRTASGAPA